MLARRADVVAELSPHERAAVRDGWLSQALMEHASVAAFARFSSMLTGLGAPPELLEGSASARPRFRPWAASRAHPMRDAAVAL